MSYDLEIVVKKRPEHSHLTEFIISRSGLGLEGRLGSDGNVIVNRQTSRGVEAVLEVWGPDKVEAEDLEEIVAQAIRTPCWLLRISVPAAEKNTVSLAEAMAIHIAKSREGLVYDPHAEAVVWPKVKLGPSSPRREEAIRVVNLSWYLGSSQSYIAMAKTFLQTVRKACPQAFPVRFGAYHPLQGRLTPGEEQPFLDALEEILRQQHAEMLELKAKAPCFGGILWVPSQRNDPRMSRVSQYVHLKLDFDGRVIESDREWCERIVSLFAELAENLRAFYAHGYVERGVFASRGGLGYGAESEHYPVPMGRWAGIPSVPYWLSWFGDPYRHLLEGSLTGPEVRHFRKGILVRLGSKPNDFDELRGTRLNLPPELVSNMKRVTKETKFPSGIIHRSEQWEATPAESVLEIG